MWNLLRKNREECSQCLEWLEDSVASAPGARSRADLVKAVPASKRAHFASCARCIAAADEFLASRALLRGVSAPQTPGPWFAPRVMAAIAARESELMHSLDTWIVIPKLAARLTWVSALALLLASGWLYERPTSPVSNLSGTDVAGESFTQNPAPANDDEILSSLAYKGEIR